MTNLKQKFIITDKGFKMGRCIFHKELNRYDDTVIGGGSWFWDRDMDTLYLYGQSHDFGGVTSANILENRKDINKRYFKNSIIVFNADPYKTLKEIMVGNGVSEERTKLLMSQNDFI